ncbi:MAG: hypothetical protein AAFP16_11805, partial [Pseudomonadota bacterium]
MTRFSIPLAASALVALGACTDPAALGTNPENPNSNRNQGALIGAGAGALLGALVSDDETDQSATKDAFELVEFIAAKRLAARRLTVIDATNVKPEDRARF